MKTCILSGRYPKTQFDSSMNHKLYADKFGYTYIHCDWPTPAKNLYLNKIFYILNYIDLFDYIIWIDDDAFFYDFDKDIMEYKPQDEKFISLCKSPSYKDLKTYFSSGQFVLQSNEISKEFLLKVIKQDISIVKDWWTDDLGFFTNGDQDIMIYLLKNNPNYLEKYILYDYKLFNSRFENLFNQDTHKPLILHFTGRPEIKLKNYNKVQQYFNLHSSLVPDLYLKKYNIPASVCIEKQNKLKVLIRNITKCLKG